MGVIFKSSWSLFLLFIVLSQGSGVKYVIDAIAGGGLLPKLLKVISMDGAYIPHGVMGGLEMSFNLCHLKVFFFHLFIIILLLGENSNNFCYKLRTFCHTACTPSGESILKEYCPLLFTFSFFLVKSIFRKKCKCGKKYTPT